MPETATVLALPSSAEELVKLPTLARGSPKRARAALEGAPAPDTASADGAAGSASPPLPFSLEDGGAVGAPGKRKGGHKKTKAELEQHARELEARLATLSGEQPAELAEAEASLRPALAGTFGAVFDMAAMARGGHWHLEETEAQALGNAWAPVLAPYMKQGAGYLPWLAAAGVTYQIVAPRVALEGRKSLEVSPGTQWTRPAPASSSSSSHTEEATPAPEAKSSSPRAGGFIDAPARVAT